MPSATTTAEDLTRAARKTQQAQLADMPLIEVIAYVRSRGYTVSARPFFRPDRLLAPLADEDIPFNAEEDRRE